MDKVVYQLWHMLPTAEEPEDGSEKLIGIFDQQHLAEEAIRIVADKPGFKDYPDGFLISEIALNKIQWNDVFISWDEANQAN